MRKLTYIILTVTCIFFAYHNAALAVTIVNTGTPLDEWGQAVTDRDGRYQSLAAEFSVNDPLQAITDIEGYFYTISSYPGNVIIQINGDAGEVPSSTSFYTGVSNVTGRGWFGLHDISGLSLGAGTYWVVFKPAWGTLVGMPTRAPNPLINEAYRTDMSTLIWNQNDSLNLGIKISGSAITPEPATISLLGLGLLGIMGFKKGGSNAAL